MTEKTVAEQAAELARTLPESASLEIRTHGSNVDYYGRTTAMGYGYFVDGEPISKELFNELALIVQARKERECAEQGHLVSHRCHRCGHEVS